MTRCKHFSMDTFVRCDKEATKRIRMKNGMVCDFCDKHAYQRIRDCKAVDITHEEE